MNNHKSIYIYSFHIIGFISIPSKNKEMEESSDLFYTTLKAIKMK